MKGVHGIAMLLLLALPAAGVAHTADDLASVLGKVRAAVDIEALEDHAMEIHGTAELFGNEVPLIFRLASDARYARHYGGPVPYADGFDGELAWMQDIGGELRQLALGERASRIVMAETLGHGWLSPATRLSLELMSSDESSVRLRFERRDGHEKGEVLIDRHTWLPYEWTVHNWTGTDRYQLEGRLPGDGTWFPERIVHADAEGVVRTTRLQRRQAADLAQLQAPPDGLPEDTSFVDTASASIETELSPYGHILVQPSINGRKLGWFIFDTGAGATVLDRQAVDALELKPVAHTQARGVGGTEDSAMYRLDTLQLGPLLAKEHVVVGLDLSFLETPMQRKIAGIIGYGVLARSVVVMDMQRGELALHDPAAFDAPGVDWASLAIEDKHPVSQGIYEGHQGMFRIDTGDGDGNVVFHSATVRRQQLLQNRATADTRIGGVGGSIDARAGELAWIEFAGQRYENLAAIFVTAEAVAHSNPYLDGTVGGGLLKGYRLLLDYSRNRVALLPDAAP